MKLYHYTSVDTLELILKNKTIKFNRLDQVDDLNEGEFTSGLIGTKLGLYTFASCWSKQEKESIPMWKMYAKWASGVRIELDKDMFNHYIHNINDGPVQVDKLETVLPLDDIYGEDYIILPIPLSEMYVDVIYTDDAKDKIKTAITENGSSFKFPEIGRYKIPEWGFQEEVKFRISVWPIDKELLKKYGDEDAVFTPLRENRKISKTCFYVGLKEEVINNIGIVLGPTISKEDENRVKILTNLYCTNATIVKSKLTGMIR